MLARGGEHPPQFYRDALEDMLTADAEAANVSPEVAELREALGVR